MFNLVQPLLLGRSLDLSPLAIILTLTFWGLMWGVAGLFLAVPITAAFAIVCRHVAGLKLDRRFARRPIDPPAPNTCRRGGKTVPG